MLAIVSVNLPSLLARYRATNRSRSGREKADVRITGNFFRSEDPGKISKNLENSLTTIRARERLE